MGNVARSPGEDKFRRIRLGNAAFAARVGSVPGGVRFLEVLGFERHSEGGEEFLVMPAAKADAAALHAAGAELDSALHNPFFGVL